MYKLICDRCGKEEPASAKDLEYKEKFCERCSKEYTNKRTALENKYTYELNLLKEGFKI